jgi:hypothetical protein
MRELKIYIPQSLELQALARAVCLPAQKVDGHGTLTGEDLDALLRYFEFLAPLALEPLMGPGLAAEFSAVIESELPLSLLRGRGDFQRFIVDYTALFAGAFCSYGPDKADCYKSWLRVRQQDFASRDFVEYDCFAVSSSVVMQMSSSQAVVDPKLHLLQYRILVRMAEVLKAAAYSPDEHLREIQTAQSPSPSQVLAMQVFVLLGRTPDELLSLCGPPINDSTESTLLFWRAQSPFLRFLLETWRWLTPFNYAEPSSRPAPSPKMGSSLLYESLSNGSYPPAGLVQRDMPTDPSKRGDLPKRFPYVLESSQEQMFLPVPIMLIGGPEVGKTSFLCALARHLNRGGGVLTETLKLESNDLQKLWESSRKNWETRSQVSTATTTHYRLRVRSSTDPDVARWMRFDLTDYKGEDVAQPTFPKDFEENLRLAKALFFFVDDRYFSSVAERAKHGEAKLIDDKNAGPPMSDGGNNEWFADARDLAAWYTRILHLFFEQNRGALHVPIALVLNKADLLLGSDKLLLLNPPCLIPESVRMELVHRGLGVNGEPPVPFERLEHCIRYDPTNSRDIATQSLINQFVTMFEEFISAALNQTFRFQVYFTSSVLPGTKDDREFPYGVWEPIRWAAKALDGAYRIQAFNQLEADRIALEKLRTKIQDLLAQGLSALEDYSKARRTKESALPGAGWLGRDAESVQHKTDSALEAMRSCLTEIFTRAQLKPIPEESDPFPFLQRREMAHEAVARLTAQIAHVEGWRKLL